MHYKPKSVAGLQIALAGPEQMRVQPEPDTHLSAKTVGQLRKLDTWPDNLVLTVPEQYQATGCVKVGKASTKGRVSPKP